MCCKSAALVMHVFKEMELHLAYCAEYGLSKDDLAKQEEHLGKQEHSLSALGTISAYLTLGNSAACVAYTRFVLDIGHSEDWLGLQMVMFACTLGYGVIGSRLDSDAKTVRNGNRYIKWIESYAGQDYRDTVQLSRGNISTCLRLLLGCQS
jgi:thiaminase